MDSKLNLYKATVLNGALRYVVATSISAATLIADSKYRNVSCVEFVSRDISVQGNE